MCFVATIAKRFRKQIFLSVDVPPAILSMSQSHKLLFAVEKGIVGALKDIEGDGRGDGSARAS